MEFHYQGHTVDDLIDLLVLIAAALGKVKCPLQIAPATFKFEPETLESLIESLPDFQVSAINPKQAVVHVIKQSLRLAGRSISSCIDSSPCEIPRIISNLCKVVSSTGQPLSQDAINEEIWESAPACEFVETLIVAIEKILDFVSFDLVVRMFLDISSKRASQSLERSQDLSGHMITASILGDILEKIWTILKKEPNNKEQIARLVCTLHAFHPAEVDTFFSLKVASGNISSREEAIQLVTLVWSCAILCEECPLVFLPTMVSNLLEMLPCKVPEISGAARAWFISSTDRLSRILDPFIRILIEAMTFIEPEGEEKTFVYARNFSVDQVIYCLNQLTEMISIGDPIILHSLNTVNLSEVHLDDLLENIPDAFCPLERTSCTVLYVIVLLSTVFSFAERAASLPYVEEQRKVEATQAAAQSLLIKSVSNSWLLKSADLDRIYTFTLSKLKYSIHLPSFHSHALTVSVLECIILRRHNFKVTAGGPSLDASDLSAIITQILESPRILDSLRSWTGFLCVSARCFDDYSAVLVAPQCRALVKILSDEISSTTASPQGSPSASFDFQRVLALSSALCDILVAYIRPSAPKPDPNLEGRKEMATSGVKFISRTESSRSMWSSLLSRDSGDRGSVVPTAEENVYNYGFVPYGRLLTAVATCE